MARPILLEKCIFLYIKFYCKLLECPFIILLFYNKELNKNYLKDRFLGRIDPWLLISIFLLKTLTYSESLIWSMITRHRRDDKKSSLVEFKFLSSRKNNNRNNHLYYGRKLRPMEWFCGKIEKRILMYQKLSQDTFKRNSSHKEKGKNHSHGFGVSKSKKTNNSIK